LIKKSNLSKLLIYIFPGLIGSLVSIFTATIFVIYLTSDKYANFILQHLAITFGTSVLSLYIGKTTIINCRPGYCCFKNLNIGSTCSTPDAYLQKQGWPIIGIPASDEIVCK
jgi:hypothetical protein